MDSQEQKIKLKDPLLWCDCEMTGLNFLNNDQIIEIATLLTDGELTQVIKGPELIIQAPKELLESMDEWCTNTHKGSGLYDKVLKSEVTLQMAEEQVIKFLKDNGIEQKEALLAGNSIHADMKFIQKQMPNLYNFLHYRLVDVSTVKELTKRWNPEILKKAPVKKGGHRALDDILESIEELKFYRKEVFKI
ncbi:oligoribonuclease (macronuclear) [Tetrahymena thermophila SB210]|uniref:Oligoribonuclease n=1 Tax=Tetrahymena thermophila (strain SB210) TaxID=312017 RepID=Q22ZB0_TETTS|nr:oligoribonuclease [Tetrahymena thermophila SB210]EAR90411.1 oligoribonuclease [Tetrahymena thermophila SB210]|eukprot:XP_001010656.1 oligoribonuclease [Tetrahymena thermophila SB210]